MKNLHVIIAGAGPAGLTLGLVLQQRSIEFTIVDGVPEERLCADVGGGYDLGPNAIKVYDQFGLGEVVKERGSRFNIIRAFSNKGKLTSTIHIPDEVEMSSVRRSTLQKILIEKLTTRNMVLGSRVTEVAEAKDNVTVTLEKGQEITGDILIGADGVHSAVRRSVLGDGESNHVGVNCLWGRVSWKKLSTTDQERFEGACMILGEGQSFLAGHMDEQLIWSTFWMANTFGASKSKQIAWKKAVDRLTPWNKEIAQIVDLSDIATISEAGIYDRPAAKTWHKHRTMLIGDAAHPMTPFLGSGANTAIADAYLLGQFIDGLQSIDEVFDFFEQRRKKPIEKIVRTARAVCDYCVTNSKWKNILMQYGMSVIPSPLMAKMLLASDRVNDISPN